MIQKEFTQTAKGVNVHLKGDFSKEQFDSIAQECNSGSCSCSCNADIKDNIDNISVSGKDGDIVLSLEGKGLKAELVASRMSSCDMEEML